MNNISLGDVGKIPLAIPPVAEQRRIVAKLEEVLEWGESVGARLARVRAALKRVRQAVLAAACSGRLTEDWRDAHAETWKANGAVGDDAARSGATQATSDLPTIPSSWAWVRLPELGELGRGRSKHRPRNAQQLFGGPYPFIQTGDIAQSGGRVTNHNQSYSEEGLAQSRLWPAGTICITIAANIANSAILTYPACFPDSVVGLVVDRARSREEYVEYFIRTARRDLSEFAPATAQKNINLAIMGDLAVPLPPLSEQDEIVRRVDAMLNLADAVEHRFETAENRLRSLHQAVLAKAFRGELVPTEAELARREGGDYEPADVLVERIRNGAQPPTQLARRRIHPIGSMQGCPENSETAPSSPVETIVVACSTTDGSTSLI